MIFSGIFGYFYGVGKYSIYLTEQAKTLGKKSILTKIISTDTIIDSTTSISVDFFLVSAHRLSIPT